MKMSVSLLVGICTLALVLASCASAPTFNYRSDPATRELLSKSPPAMPAARFMSISDLHLYDGANLGQEGAAFQDYLDRDRKLLRESPEILARALQSVIAEHPDFLLVSGDLTKDGERVNHELAAKMLGTVEAAGIKVFVINGNHDINNPDAMRFSGEKTEAVPGIDPAGFAAIYADFGYAEAIDRDPASLSYVVEPVPGLWLLAIDSCRYDTNYADGEPVIPGRLDGHRLAWVEKTLLRARAEGKAVIGMQHHGMVEHYPSQEQYYGEYLLDDHDAIGRMYAELG